MRTTASNYVYYLSIAYFYHICEILFGMRFLFRLSQGRECSIVIFGIFLRQREGYFC